MKYYDIKQKLVGVKVFSVADLFIVDHAFRLETLYEWEKKGWVIKLRSKRYIFADYQPTGYDLYLIGNKLYEPSYVSLELALNHYGVIPEAVARITSVTTNKTLGVETPIGSFDYRTLSTRLFFEYQIMTDGQTTYKMATLEKAIVDYLYLNPQIVSVEDIESLRFNVELLRESLNLAELERITEVFKVASLRKRVQILINYLQI